MAAQNVRIIFDMSGNLFMIVVPSYDRELGDPAFTYANTVGVNIPMSNYMGAQDLLALLQAAQPYVAQVNSQVGTNLQNNINQQQGQGKRL